MCEFCDNITNRDKEIRWLVRSTYAEDNICEFANGHNCDDCNDCNMKFVLSGYTYNDNVMVGIDYEHRLKTYKGKDVIIHPFSESMQFNYCPICGKQISKHIRDFEKYYEIEING